MRIVGSKTLGKDVVHTGRFEYCTSSPASNDASTGGSGLHENTACPEMPKNLIRNRFTFHDRHLDQVFLGLLHTLANRLGNLMGLSESVSYISCTIAYDNKCRKAEPTATLDDFRDTADMHYPVRQIQFIWINLKQSPPP